MQPLCLIAATSTEPWQGSWTIRGLHMSVAAAVAAPLFRANAVHMAIRYATLAIIFGLTLLAAGTRRRLRALLVGVLAAGGVVAVLVIADYTGAAMVERFLSAFREGVAVVGT